MWIWRITSTYEYVVIGSKKDSAIERPMPFVPPVITTVLKVIDKSNGHAREATINSYVTASNKDDASKQAIVLHQPTQRSSIALHRVWPKIADSRSWLKVLDIPSSRKEPGRIELTRTPLLAHSRARF